MEKTKLSQDCELVLINLLASHDYYARIAARESDPVFNHDFEIMAATLRRSIDAVCRTLNLPFTCTRDLIGDVSYHIEGVEWPRRKEGGEVDA